MKDGLLLIVGDRIDGQLLEAVQGAGYVAVFMRSMSDALVHIRHGQFVAIVVDGRRQWDDVLEFALNVRDLRHAIPILVIGSCGSKEAARAMGCQPNTKLLPADVSVRELIGEMNALAQEDATYGSSSSHERKPL